MDRHKQAIVELLLEKGKGKAKGSGAVGGGLAEDIGREVKKRISKAAKAADIEEDVVNRIKKGIDADDVMERLMKGAKAALGGAEMSATLKREVMRRVADGVKDVLGGGEMEDDIEEDAEYRVKKALSSAKKDIPAVGDAKAVWEGLARHTPGGLTKKDLMISPSTGKVVSKKKYRAGVLLAKQYGIPKKA
jgi:predicted small metal-binding protein